MTLLQFADLIDKQLTITYYANQNGRFCCHFDSGEIKNGALLSTEFRNGLTPEIAMNYYAEAISGKTIVFHAMSEERRTAYRVPTLEKM